jgi:diaminopimelate epimerase
MSVPVTKMHGAGNDFVVLDQRKRRLDALGAFARWCCARHTGIGADGLIVIEESRLANVRMRTINADGTEAEMCGNGIRCAARWLDEAGEGDRCSVETSAGLVKTEIVAREPEYLVRVMMEGPRVAAEPLPFLDGARFVDVGNPHVVLLRKNVDDVDLGVVAPKLQDPKFFAGGANVHVVAIEGNGLRVRHWERGAGLTRACGTGAVACAAVGLREKLVTSPVEVHVPGGRLTVDWDGRGKAYLTGPAVRVFDTQVRVEDDV